MNPLELRKIVIVAYAFDAPDGAPVLDAQGLPLAPVECPVKFRVAFWVPAKQPFQRCDGATVVGDARPFEIQALKDGAIVEELQDFTFPRQPTMPELVKHLMPHWEKRTVSRLGVLPNAPPVDTDPKPRIEWVGTGRSDA